MTERPIQNLGFVDVSNFFEVHRIQPLNQVLFASIHFTGEAQLWFHNFKKKNRSSTWREMKHMWLGFGPHVFEDYYEELTRLQQAGTVKEYTKKFNQLLARVGELPEHQQVSSYINGLK